MPAFVSLITSFAGFWLKSFQSNFCVLLAIMKHKLGQTPTSRMKNNHKAIRSLKAEQEWKTKSSSIKQTETCLVSVFAVFVSSKAIIAKLKLSMGTFLSKKAKLYT